MGAQFRSRFIFQLLAGPMFLNQYCAGSAIRDNMAKPQWMMPAEPSET